MEQIEQLVTKAADDKAARADRLTAFGMIVQRFQDMAYGYAYAILGDFHLAQDAAQEAFLVAYRELPNLRSPKAFPGWFRQIVLSRCHRLTRRTVPAVGLDAAASAVSAEPEPPEVLENREMKDTVLAAIRALPEHQRMATTLFYINGYSQKDIAEFLGVPVTTIKKRLHDSRTRLKERMIAMVSKELQTNKPGPEFSKWLFNGINLDKWVILSEPTHYEIENGELVVENPTGDGAALHAEVGGMSWDDYRAGVEVLVERNSSAEKRFPFNVQLCPRGTSVFCQLFGGNVILAYWDKDREPHFTHLDAVERPMPMGKWHQFEILVQNAGVALFFNSEKVIEKQVPRGTDGMLGLIVNCDSDARVRLRNLRITFLKPTPQQLKELQTDASTNWEDYKRREIAVGKRSEDLL